MKYFLLTLFLVISLLLFYVDSSIYFLLMLVLLFLAIIYKYARSINNYIFLPTSLYTIGSFIFIWVPSLLMDLNVVKYYLNVYNKFNETTTQKAILLTLISNIVVWFVFFILNDIVKNNNSNITNYKINFRNRHITLLFAWILIVSLYIFFFNGSFGYYAVNDNLVNFTNSIFNLLMLIICYRYWFYKLDINLIILILVVLLFTIISGSKSLIILPILYLSILHFFKYKRINKVYIFIFVGLLLFAFIVTPLIRTVYEENNGVVNDLSTVFSISNNSTTVPGEDLLNRLNYVPVLNRAIEYKGQKPEAVENLWKYTFFSPIYAVVPRFIYKEKPTTDFGRWFSFNVAGSTDTNNISATYQGILYMNNGIISVILGFVIVGVIMFVFYKHFFTLNNIPFYISNLLLFISLKSEPWMLISGVIQSVIVFLLFKMIFIKKTI